MVNITKLRAGTGRTLAYVICNEWGGTLCTDDYVTKDIPIENVTVIDTFNIELLKPVHCFSDLFVECWMEYARAIYKYSGYTCRISTELLPIELADQLSPEYLTWCHEESDGCVETNGDEVFVDENYTGPVDNDIKRFQRYMDEMYKQSKASDAAGVDFTNQKFVIGFGSRMLVLDNDFDRFDFFQRMLDALCRQ
jgi:hypothetical protein